MNSLKSIYKDINSLLEFKKFHIATIRVLMHYKIKNIFLDLSLNSLKINNRPVECPTKIYQALKLLLESNNETVTKEYLISTLWGDLIVSDDSLFKIIQGLRKLFRENSVGDDILINVYGKGYKLKPPIERIITTEILKQPETNTIIEKKSWHIYLLIIFTVSSVIILLAFILNSNNNTAAISDTKYQAYIKEIDSAPLIFLANIDHEFETNQLSNEDFMALYSLKGYAHFNQGQYAQTLDFYQKVFDLSDDKDSLASADAYYNAARIYLYKQKPNEMLVNITKAIEIYNNLENKNGLFDAEYIHLLYFYIINDYATERNLAQKLFQQAQKENHPLGEIYALINLYNAHTALNQPAIAKGYILQALEVALKLGNGKYISFCYGSMAVNSMNEGDFINAMKWSNQTLKYAVEQPSTNNFQQGFSYIYNILSPLGHNVLAEKYLQKAINVQNHLNSEGHIHTAELNLAILKIKLKKYNQAKVILSSLLTYKLLTQDRLITQAWTAINQYYLNDIISAYSLSKEIFNTKLVQNKIKFVAGIALALSAAALERSKESDQALQQVNKMANQNWLIEYRMYLLSAIQLSKSKTPKIHHGYQEKLKVFQQKLRVIKSQTTPNLQTLQQVDKYIEQILN